MIELLQKPQTNKVTEIKTAESAPILLQALLNTEKKLAAEIQQNIEAKKTELNSKTENIKKASNLVNSLNQMELRREELFLKYEELSKLERSYAISPESENKFQQTKQQYEKALKQLNNPFSKFLSTFGLRKKLELEVKNSKLKLESAETDHDKRLQNLETIIADKRKVSSELNEYDEKIYFLKTSDEYKESSKLLNQINEGEQEIKKLNLELKKKRQTITRLEIARDGQITIQKIGRNKALQPEPEPASTTEAPENEEAEKPEEAEAAANAVEVVSTTQTTENEKPDEKIVELLNALNLPSFSKTSVYQIMVRYSELYQKYAYTPNSTAETFRAKFLELFPNSQEFTKLLEKQVNPEGIKLETKGEPDPKVKRFIQGIYRLEPTSKRPVFISATNRPLGTQVPAKNLEFYSPTSRTPNRTQSGQTRSAAFPGSNGRA